MTLLAATITAQWFDAMTFAAGMALMTPIEASPVAALGPGVTLAAKAGAMALLALTRNRWGWRYAAWTAFALGAFGAMMNAGVMLGAG
jgi:hypothetical protein